MVAVAQLVESRIVIPVVVGSSPIGHPKVFWCYFPSVGMLVSAKIIKKAPLLSRLQVKKS